MNKLNKDILYTIKKIITSDNLDELQKYYNYLQTSDIQINYDIIFQHSYIHSCLLHRTKIIKWLTELFNKFDLITQIALKHVFTYGRYLQNKKNPYLDNNLRYVKN
jgi:hypothetical protein